jgi:hypothetical protein
MKSSFHSLIPFLPLLCNFQFRRLESIEFLCSQAQIQAGWCLETRLDYDFSNEIFFITTLHGPPRKHTLSIFGKARLRSRCIATEISSVVACVFVAVGMSLPSRCLAMNVYSDLTIPAFGRNATKYITSLLLCEFVLSSV